MTKAFGELLRRARESRKMTQVALATKTDVDQTYISKLERGALPPPSRKVVMNFLDALNIVDPVERARYLLAAGHASYDDMEQALEAAKIMDTPEAQEMQKLMESLLSQPKPNTNTVNVSMLLADELGQTVLEQAPYLVRVFEEANLDENQAKEVLKTLMDMAKVVSARMMSESESTS